jgi:glycosyltransferase involved in cell wall biosynthesis
MIRVAHVFDRSCGWPTWMRLAQLLDDLPRDRYVHRVATLDGETRTTWLRDLPVPVTLCGQRFGLPVTAAPGLRRWLATESTGSRLSADVVHAWGTAAALASIAASRDEVPVVGTMLDPALSPDQRKLMRQLTTRGGLRLVCGSGTVRRRLIEGGVPPERCVVVRPGVEFGTINRARGGALRTELDWPADQQLIVLGHIDPRGPAARDICFALAVGERLTREDRLVAMAADHPAADRVQRFAKFVPHEVPLLVIPPGSLWGRVVAAADIFLLVGHEDVETESLAWAMAAGARVIAPAIPSVAELISHRVNGQLFPPCDDVGGSSVLYRHLQPHEDATRWADVARGQAFEVFSRRRFVEQMQQVFENVRAGRAVGEGIQDAAVSA